MTQRIILLQLILGLIFTLTSCDSTRNNLTDKQIVENYFKGFNTGDFNVISNCVSDSIIVTELDYVVARGKKDLYQHFQWDSVFNPHYELLNFKRDSNSIVFKVAKVCKRIDFLQDTSYIYKIKVDFKSNQIVKMHTSQYIFWDSVKWEPRRDSLVTWIDKNHPELSGFLYDMSLKGAQKYLNAIELFKNENNMNDTKNLAIVKDFILAINSANIDKIGELMHENHKFIDSQNNIMTGKENIKKAWITYFDLFPDYKIEFEKVFENESSVALFGFAEGTYKTGLENHWKVPAAWIAILEDKKIIEWQVYTDLKPVLEIIEKNK